MLSHLSTLVEIAADLRRQSRQYTLPFSTTQIVEHCFPNTLVTGRVLPRGVLEAVARTDRGPVILYARGIPTPHARYVIAHALGHLLFDGDNAFRLPGQQADLDAETRANAFADELLVPFDYLEARLKIYPSNGDDRDVYLDHVDALASKFGVLSEVISRRVADMLGLVRIAA